MVRFKSTILLLVFCWSHSFFVTPPQPLLFWPPLDRIFWLWFYFVSSIGVLALTFCWIVLVVALGFLICIFNLSCPWSDITPLHVMVYGTHNRVLLFPLSSLCAIIVTQGTSTYAINPTIRFYFSFKQSIIFERVLNKKGIFIFIHGVTISGPLHSFVRISIFI